MFPAAENSRSDSVDVAGTARTLPALPGLDSALHSFSTMTADSPSWTGDALRNTSRPPSAQFGLSAAPHPLHHWCWSLMMNPVDC